MFSISALHEFSAGVEIRASADFYAPLGDLGVWVDVGNYGRCWHPRRVARDWRPYTDGSWVWTDTGWYWESDEPWSWACYHYGRWAYDDSYGWVWVPDVEWGPSWVEWRYGGGYCGWAPLPPGVGFDFEISPSFFAFVEIGHFHERIRPSRLIFNNRSIINKTANVTNIRRETRTFGNAGRREVFVNEGPRFDEIQRATHNKVRHESINTVVQKTPYPKTLRQRSSEKVEPSAQDQRRQREELNKQDRRERELEHRDIQREQVPQERQSQREQEIQREQPRARIEPQPEQRTLTPTSRPEQAPRIYRSPHDDRIHQQPRPTEPRPNFVPPGELKREPQPQSGTDRGRDKERERP